MTLYQIKLALEQNCYYYYKFKILEIFDKNVEEKKKIHLG